MEFKNDIGKARMFAKLSAERPFEYSLQKVVTTISIHNLVHTMNNDIWQTSGSGAPSMVYDGLRQMEEKGISNDESWMKELKEACGTAFGGT